MKETKPKQGTHRGHVRPDGERRKTYVAPVLRREGALKARTGLVGVSPVGPTFSPTAMPDAPTRPLIP